MTEPRVRNFSPWAQWMLDLAADAPADPFPAAGTAAEDGAWRVRTLERLDAMLGPWPVSVPPDAEVTDSVPCAGYRRERVVFDSEATMSVPAYRLVPDGRDDEPPGAAVLAIHGHGAGKSEVCGVDDSAARRSREIDVAAEDYARQLARRGHIVLAPDLRCFGERADRTPPDKYGCDLNLVHAVAAGRNPLGQNVWDLMRCVDLLVSDPRVHPGRIGAAGFSYGGTAALFLAALDPRIAAAVVSGYVSTWSAAHSVPFNLCGSQVAPGLVHECTHADLLAVIAPRPVLVVSGTEDPIFPVEGAREIVAAAAPAFLRAGAPAGLEHHVFEGDHRWDGTRAHPFLDHHLRGV